PARCGGLIEILTRAGMRGASIPWHDACCCRALSRWPSRRCAALVRPPATKTIMNGEDAANAHDGGLDDAQDELEIAAEVLDELERAPSLSELLHGADAVGVIPVRDSV